MCNDAQVWVCVMMPRSGCVQRYTGPGVHDDVGGD